MLFDAYCITKVASVVARPLAAKVASGTES